MSQTEEALRRRIAELEQQLAALSRDRDPLAEERLRAIVAATAHVTYRMSPDWKEMWQLDGRGLLYDAKSPNRNWLQEYIPPRRPAGSDGGGGRCYPRTAHV